MYKIVLLIALLSLGGFVILQKTSTSKLPTTICTTALLHPAPKPEKPNKDRIFTLLPQKSQLNWTIGTSAENGSHVGTLRFTTGRLLITNENSIKEGDFLIDLNDIASPVIQSEDFLAVSRFPKAHFSVLSIIPVDYYNVVNAFDNRQMIQVTGNLTLRGVTHSIVFNAFRQDVQGFIQVKADVSIEGSKWGIPAQIAAQAIKLKLDLVFGGGGC